MFTLAGMAVQLRRNTQVPHYTLGVFFVLTHLLAGLRVVLEAHGAAKRCINLLWYTGLGGAALLALAIIAGMCGVRI
ncbi:hypothetical protein ACEUDM_02675 [Aeromonas caviae]|uniref:hypothetical protein n=1 Tax=Aeromonas caviae TaxID=648 RepID=UPI0038D006DA